jgi:hypothetical protein
MVALRRPFVGKALALVLVRGPARRLKIDRVAPSLAKTWLGTFRRKRVALVLGVPSRFFGAVMWKVEDFWFDRDWSRFYKNDGEFISLQRMRRHFTAEQLAEICSRASVRTPTDPNTKYRPVEVVDRTVRVVEPKDDAA